MKGFFIGMATTFALGFFGFIYMSELSPSAMARKEAQANLRETEALAMQVDRQWNPAAYERLDREARYSRVTGRDK